MKALVKVMYEDQQAAGTNESHGGQTLRRSANACWMVCRRCDIW